MVDVALGADRKSLRLEAANSNEYKSEIYMLRCVRVLQQLSVKLNVTCAV